MNNFWLFQQRSKALCKALVTKNCEMKLLRWFTRESKLTQLAQYWNTICTIKASWWVITAVAVAPKPWATFSSIASYLIHQLGLILLIFSKLKFRGCLSHWHEQFWILVVHSSWKTLGGADQHTPTSHGRESSETRGPRIANLKLYHNQHQHAI